MSSIVWPTSVLPIQSVMFHRRTMSRSGGISITGTEQVVASISDRWTSRISTKIRKYTEAAAYRALIHQSDGRSATWLVSPCAFGFTQDPSVPFSDAATFTDNSGFFTTYTGVSLPGSVTSAKVLANAIKGVRSLSIQVIASSQPISGMYFSIGERLYLITTILNPSPNIYTVGIRPGLREAVAVNTSIDFVNTRCRMRLASDDTGEMDLESLRFSTVNLNFVEDF